MANDVSALLVPLLAQGLQVLRNVSVVTRYINRQFDRIPGQKFSTVNVPVSSAVTAVNVTPANTPPASTNTVPTVVPVTLDQWKEAPFTLTDSDLMKVTNGIIPMQASEAIKALVNAIEADIFSKRLGSGPTAPGIYNFAGTAGTTPFATDVSAYTSARRNLNKWNVSKNDRAVLLDVDAEANAIGLRAFQDASFGGGAGVIVEGEIGRKLGATWAQSNNLPSNTPGTQSGSTTNAAGYAVGIKTVTLASAGTGTIVIGDVISFANHAQTYVVTAGDTDVSNGGTISFEPGLQVALPTSAQAITTRQAFVSNLLIHRDAFAFASRPLAESVPEGAANLAAFETIVDEFSGIALRLELTREHKQWRWSFDALWGAALVRPEAASYIAG